MPTAELTTVRMWYDEHGRGDPCVMLHPGGAGVDSRALVPTREGLSRVFHVYAAMHRSLPVFTEAELARITCRTLVMVADDDEIRLEHAIAMYRSLPDSELAVVPGTSHGLLVEKPDLCNLLIMQFMTQDPVPTFAPIRRAASAPG